VPAHSRLEIAAKAGVDAEYVDQLVELGILRPSEGDSFSPGDVLRARWVKNFERAGLPLDGLAEAVRNGALSFSFLDVSAFDRFASVTDQTFEEVSEGTGIPFDLLVVVREAFGYAEPSPQDRIREDEMAVIAAIELQLSEGFRPAAIEDWLRVYAESLRRVAETETDWYRTEVTEPLLESGLTEGEMMEAQAGFGSVMSPLIEQSLIAIYHGQQEHVWTKAAVETLEVALEKAGLFSRLHHPPAVTFLDLTGYTRLTEERGDQAAADLASRLRAMVRQTSLKQGGDVIKWLGDGVMSYFPDPASGVVSSLEMVERAKTRSLPPARVGIHAGPVIFQEGDYFGRTVNIASRIADYASPGEVVVSQEVVEAIPNGGLRFSEIGPVDLKGVVGAPRLYTAHRDR
jgi:adenylate cyclase